LSADAMLKKNLKSSLFVQMTHAISSVKGNHR
jgi:hypothetical protein